MDTINFTFENNKQNIDIYIYKDKILPVFGNAIKERKNLVLNFQNADFIDNGIVPKLCCMGEIAKRNNINIKIEPSYAIAIYLDQMGFWELAIKNNLFIFDDKYLGIGRYERKKVVNALFSIDKEYLKRKYENVLIFVDGINESLKYKYYVRAELFGTNNIFNSYINTDETDEKSKALLYTISKFDFYFEEYSQNNIIKAITEIVHNSVWHSLGRCYLCVQTSGYSKENGLEKEVREGMNISVSDCGCGLYQSFLNKDEKDIQTKNFSKDTFLKIQDKTKQNSTSIIEALLYRKNSETRGLYDILEDLASETVGNYSELNIINGNVSFQLKEGKQWKIGNDIEYHSISDFIKGDLRFIKDNQNDYFKKLDYDSFFSFDVKLTRPIMNKGGQYDE
jgi:hypothetical protein